MTVRLIPTESDSTPPPHDPSPPEPLDGSKATPAGELPPNPTPASRDDGPDGPPDDTSGEVPSSDAGPSEAPSSAAGPSVDSAEPVEYGSGSADSRVALREARRQRRRVAWLCAAIVAICLALTIAVVSMARNRPAPTSGSVAWSALVVPSTDANGGMALPHEPFPGAPAPEGGNP